MRQHCRIPRRSRRIIPSRHDTPSNKFHRRIHSRHDMGIPAMKYGIKISSTTSHSLLRAMEASHSHARAGSRIISYYRVDVLIRASRLLADAHFDDVEFS